MPNRPSGKGSREDDTQGGFQIQGQVSFEELGAVPSDLKVMAHVFDSQGKLLGESPLDSEGKFSLGVKGTNKPFDGEVVLGPADSPSNVSGSALYRQSFSSADWQQLERGFSLSRAIFLPKYIWWPWWPRQICIRGHVRKIAATPTGWDICPVPYVKVEVFDVDRESCWWPPIYRWWDHLLDKLVVRAEDLLKPLPPDPGPLRRPIPQPDPSPIAFFSARSRFEQVALNPQPLPPREFDQVFLNPQPLPPEPPPGRAFAAGSNLTNLGDIVGFNPQPDPPRPATLQMMSLRQATASSAAVSSALASRLQNLTITSKLAPWLLFPGCFYSTAEVCETTTDCDGYFECCFSWYPWHIRRGRLRFDPFPDVIIKVTQVIGGVETVIYMDPYSSTRWNVSTAHIDLWLDDPQVQCGSGCSPQPTGPVTFLTLVGLDEVYKINQTTGKFNNIPYGGGLSHWAYGGNLLICGLFGDALSTGAPMRYYRLSYRKGADPWTPIQTPLSDTRVDGSFNSDIHYLGPQVVNGVPDLFEVRDTANYLWYNPDKIGWWYTEGIEPHSDLYTVRLEVFDENGVKMTSATVDYRDGTTPPPGPLPSMVDSCDLNILIDNDYPDMNLGIPAAGGDCGVVSCADRGSLAFHVHVDQPNARLYSWALSYVQGLGASSGTLGSNSNGSGLATPVNLTIPAGPPFTTTLETCAYSLTLGAWPLVRNGFGVIHWNSQTKAIAVEAC